MKFHGLPNYFLKKQKQNSLLLFQELLWFASPLTIINGLCGGSGINSFQSHLFWRILNFYSLNIPRAKDFFFLLHGTHAKTLSLATRAVNNYHLPVNRIQILQILHDLVGVGAHGHGAAFPGMQTTKHELPVTDCQKLPEKTTTVLQSIVHSIKHPEVVTVNTSNSSRTYPGPPQNTFLKASCFSPFLLPQRDEAKFPSDPTQPVTSQRALGLQRFLPTHRLSPCTISSGTAPPVQSGA